MFFFDCLIIMHDELKNNRNKELKYLEVRMVIDRRRTDEGGLVRAAGMTTGTGELQGIAPIERELKCDHAAT